jgi:hypothetical protein
MSAKSMLEKCGLTAADVRRLTEPYRIGRRRRADDCDDGTPPKGPWMGFKGGCSMSSDTGEDADLQYHGGACYEPPEA